MTHCSFCKSGKFLNVGFSSLILENGYGQKYLSTNFLLVYLKPRWTDTRGLNSVLIPYLAKCCWVRDSD